MPYVTASILDIAYWRCPICDKGFAYGEKEGLFESHLNRHEKEELVKALLKTERELDDMLLEGMEEYD